MMQEWWSYRPGDFLLFSPRTYWRLFQLTNEALWPLQIPVLLIGAAILAMLLHPRAWAHRFSSPHERNLWQGLLRVDRSSFVVEKPGVERVRAPS
jgi:hypothetical protein